MRRAPRSSSICAGNCRNSLFAGLSFALHPEQVDDEVLHDARLLGCLVRPARLHQSGGCAQEHRAQHRGHGSEADPIPQRRLAESIPGSVRLGQHPFALQVPLDVLRERVGGGVTRRRHALERLAQDGVDLAAQRPGGGLVLRSAAGRRRLAFQHLPPRALPALVARNGSRPVSSSYSNTPSE
jgi:hypothetical protein